MAKKNKIQKKTPRTPVAKITPTKRAITADKTRKETLRADELIRFDMKVKIFLVVMISTYVIVSLLKIHTSSIASWDRILPNGESGSVIAGKPRLIRMDEWSVSTPGVLSQYQLGMPINNPSLGAKHAPVVMALPVRDISTLLRPNFWSYFLFDEERAFAFSWNFNIFLCLITTFLLFMLLTRNKFWLSLFGSFFVFFSGGVQWWSYAIGNQVMYLNGIIISFIYILYSKKLWSLILSGAFLLICVHSFLFNLYPAFQVPLIYLYLFILIGFLWQRKNFKNIKENIVVKGAVLGVTVIVLAVVLFHYYHLVKDTYAAMTSTYYPGKRFSKGGDLIKGKFFSEFFGMFMTDEHVPSQWLNICEASGFIMFFPIIFYSMGRDYYVSKKIDSLAVSLSVFFIIGSIYVLVGFPTLLSKVTLISMSPSFRALPVFEAGNCFLLICYLGSRQTEERERTFSWVEFGILVIGIFAFIRIVGSYINKATDNFFTAEQVNVVTLLVTMAYLLIRYKNYRFAKPALYGVLAIMTISNVLVNPMTAGLSSVLEKPIIKMTKEIHDKDPSARWVVFDKEGIEGARVANFLETNGINTFNGVKFVPPLTDMRVLDPAGKRDSAYNRYAWISLQTFINGTDTIVFDQHYFDAYTIFMDPCSPRLKTLGVKYVVFNYKPQESEVRCMTKLGEASGKFIYKRKDE